MSRRRGIDPPIVCLSPLEMVVDSQHGSAPSAAEVEDRLRSILQLLTRAKKSLRIYHENSPVTANLETQLHQQLSQLLEELGEVALAIGSAEIRFHEVPVYDNPDRRESLAFLFFRDGIRTLTFLPGLERNELRSFLDCLNRVGALLAAEDDLVTLFWECDFQHIRYFAVDELSEEGSEPGMVEGQLAVGIVDPALLDSAYAEETREARPGGGGATLDDLERPEALPVESARLTESEIEKLRHELDSEEDSEPVLTVAELAAELVELEAEGEREGIVTSLLAVFDRSLASGEPLAVARAVERLSDLSQTTFGGSAVSAWLVSAVIESLAKPLRLARLLESLDQPHDVEDEVQCLLSRLAPRGLSIVFEVLPRLQQPEARRAASRAAAEVGEGALVALSRHLSSLPEAPSRRLVTEALYMTRRVPQADREVVVELIERLLTATRGDARREVALTLGRLRLAGAEPLWLSLLDDEHPRVRRLALSALARTGDIDSARRVLRTVQAADGPERDLEELKLALATVAKLGSDPAVEWLEEMLQPARRRWFLSRSKQDLVEAAAHGIAALGTARARAALETLARAGDRFCRAACRRELRQALREAGGASR